MSHGRRVEAPCAVQNAGAQRLDEQVDATTEQVPPTQTENVAQTVVPDAAQAQVAAPTQPPPQESNGIQKRIDELTAEKYEARRAAEALQQQNAELTNNLARLMAQQVEARYEQARPQAPDVEIDEGTRKILDAYVAPKLGAQERTIRALQEQLAQAEYAQAAAKFEPLVQARAKDLMNAWSRGGQTGWTPQDALIYAQGELALRTPRDEKGRFTTPPAQKPPEVFTRAPAQVAPAAPGSAVAPEYLNPTSPEYDANKAIAYYEKTLDGKAF